MKTVEVNSVGSAKELCIKAHSGQFRRPYLLNGREFLSYGDEVRLNGRYHQTNSVILSDGSRYKLNGGQMIEKPYHVHPIAVADMLTSKNEKIIGYLHDVIEDCDEYDLNIDVCFKHGRRIENYSITYLDETKYIISNEVGECIQSLTKTDKCQSYESYILDMVQVNDTLLETKIRVKIADIAHNLSDNPTEPAKKKYLNAMQILLESIL